MEGDRGTWHRGSLRGPGDTTHSQWSDKTNFIQKSMLVITTELLNEALWSPLPTIHHPSPPTPTLSFGLCRMLEKPSPGSARDPGLCAGSSPRWPWARTSPAVQRERPVKLPPVSKSSGPGQVAIPLAQGLTGEEGVGAGPSYMSFSHLEKQLEAKQKAHLEEPVSTGMFQAHLDE